MGEIVPAQQLTVAKSRAVANLAEFCDVSNDEIAAILRDMVMPGAKGAEMIAFAMVCLSYKLDPLKKQIYAFKNRDGVWQAGLYIDGWIEIINRHEDFAGMTISMADHPNSGAPHSATVTIVRKSRPQFPTTVTEYFDECKGPTEPWRKWPRRMLRHRAIIQCARVALGFSGLADAAEAMEYAAVRERLPVSGNVNARQSSLNAALLAATETPPPADGASGSTTPQGTGGAATEMPDLEPAAPPPASPSKTPPRKPSGTRRSNQTQQSLHEAVEPETPPQAVKLDPSTEKAIDGFLDDCVKDGLL